MSGPLPQDRKASTPEHPDLRNGSDCRGHPHFDPNRDAFTYPQTNTNLHKYPYAGAL